MALLLSMPFGAHAVELVDRVTFVTCKETPTTYLSKQDRIRLQKDCLKGIASDDLAIAEEAVGSCEKLVGYDDASMALLALGKFHSGSYTHKPRFIMRQRSNEYLKCFIEKKNREKAQDPFDLRKNNLWLSSAYWAIAKNEFFFSWGNPRLYFQAYMRHLFKWVENSAVEFHKVMTDMEKQEPKEWRDFQIKEYNKIKDVISNPKITLACNVKLFDISIDEVYSVDLWNSTVNELPANINEVEITWNRNPDAQATINRLTGNISFGRLVVGSCKKQSDRKF